MHRWVMLAIAAVPLVLTVYLTPTPAFLWWTATALEKISPNDNPPTEPKKSASIAAARNEFESFQIVLRAQSQQIDAVDVEISDLHGPKNAVITKENVTIYLEPFVDLKQLSNVEGRAGEWADPLIPRVDRYYGQRRNAFPFKLLDGRNQPVWIEIFVPPATPAGVFNGDVSVNVHEKRQLTIPVRLEVWNFTLPVTSSLPNTYGFSGISAVRQHFGRYTKDDDVRSLVAVYQKAALLHRISIHGGSMTPPRYKMDRNRIEIDWSKYDVEVGPFLNGTAIRNGEPLYGAKATTIDMRTSDIANTDEARILYWRAYAQHFRENGWFDRLFDYVWDEPSKTDSAAVLHKAQLIRGADPAIRTLVTVPLNPAWTQYIDIWAPLVNCFEPRSGFEPFCEPMTDRSAYQAELNKGKSVWWYQSCASHGCNTVGGAYFTGWPSYMIDVSPVANRIMEWMTWKYGIQGELYFSMNVSYGDRGGPWDDINRFGGNGDGTLFYPGVPQRIGGTTQIPIESIRLKLIRDGLEDYEYLNMLGSSPLAREAADSLVHKTYEFEHDPEKLYAARRRLGEELSKRGG